MIQAQCTKCRPKCIGPGLWFHFNFNKRRNTETLDFVAMPKDYEKARDPRTVKNWDLYKRYPMSTEVNRSSKEIQL